MSKDRRLTWTFSGQIPATRPDGSPSVRLLEDDDMDVVFQPIVDVAKRRLFAYEVLARCRHAAYADPEALFRAASEQHACGHLGRIVRSVAFSRALSKPLFVNVHPDELTSRWIVRPDDPLCFHDAGVYLEITETAAFDYFDLCLDVLKEICDRTGAKLVVDDFGAGHSNLERVFELRPSVVKLDGSLVRGLGEEERRQVFVRRLVDMCTDLGAKVCAEGVETVEELKAVRDAGVHYVQGYLLAQPADPPLEPVWPLRPSARPRSRRPSTPAGRRRSGAPPAGRGARLRKTKRDQSR